MTWKNFVSPLAIAPRRRVVATALVYGLSLTVRFTSPTGEETEIPAQAAQGTDPMTSIMINDGVPIFYNDQGSKSVRSILFYHRSPPSFRGCRAACERPMPISSLPDCSPP
jgi:hypothetical protein